MATGRCLCEAVRYEVRGPLHDVLICHCELDGNSGLRVAGHVYMFQRADYYDVPDDGLPHHDRAGGR